jgi:hypothetical protein
VVDIFLSPTGKKVFQIKDNLIFLVDFQDNEYILDFDGNQVAIDSKGYHIVLPNRIEL